MKKCEICNSENRVFISKISGQLLCHKHSLQLRRNGFIAKSERYGRNKYKELESHYVLYIKNYKNGEVLAEILVDKEDFEKVHKYKWDLSQGYARNRELGLMHRFILSGVGLVDHVNQDKCDNRRSNLREADKRLNSYNSFKAKSNNKSGLRGVTKRGEKYRATIRIQGKQTHIGTFDTPEEAHEAYLKKLKEVM